MEAIREAGYANPDLKVLLAAVEASGEAVVVTSADLEGSGPRIEYVNPAFTRMTGHEAHEILGRTPRLLQGPGTERAMLDRMRAALAAGENFQAEALNYRKDGLAYVVERLIAPVREADGRITRWISAQRDVTERRRVEDRRNLMVAELHHRVRNTLATVKAVLEATLDASADPDEFRQAFSDRIASLAKTHALITADEDQAVSFEDLLRSELEAYEASGRPRVSLRGPHVLLVSEQAVSLGMTLHELTVNAIRHGSLRDPNGRLEVRWSVEEGPTERILHWTWDEHDGPPVALPTQEGFGMELLRRLLTYQIGARVDLAFDPDGLRVTAAVPLGEAASRA